MYVKAYSIIKKYCIPTTSAVYDPNTYTWKIGYNQTIGVYNGLRWTEKQIEQDLRKQIQTFAAILNLRFPLLNIYQLNALLSLIHDIGMEKFLQSDFTQHILNENYVLAEKLFMNFNKVNRVAKTQLSARRHEEQLLFKGEL